MRIQLPTSNLPPVESCAICLRTFPADTLNQCCGCGELHCLACPAFACSCIDEDDPPFQARREQLRAEAMELARLQVQSELMGAESLTKWQRARLPLLVDIVANIRAEVNRMDEIRYGEVYPEDDELAESGEYSSREE